MITSSPRAALARRTRTTIASVVLASLSFTIVPAAQAAPAEGQTSSVGGRVQSVAGAPIADVEIGYDNVSCEDGDDLTEPDDYAVVQASSTGQFSFPAFAGECYTLDLEDSGHFSVGSGPQAERHIVQAGATDLLLSIAPSTTVTVATAGAPEDSEINLYRWGGFSWDYENSSWLSAAGEASFDISEQGTYTVRLERSGDFFGQWLGGSVGWPENLADVTTFTAGPTDAPRTVQFAPRAGATATGSIAWSGAAPSYVSIEAHRWDTINAEWIYADSYTSVDLGGTFALRALEPGVTYTLSASSESHVTQWLGGYVGSSPGHGDVATFVAPASGGTLTGLTPRLDVRAGAIEVVVTGFSDDTRVSVENVATGDTSSSWVDQGRARMTTLAPGTYWVTARDFGHDLGGDAFDVTVTPDGVTTTTIAAAPRQSVLSITDLRGQGDARVGGTLTAAVQTSIPATSRFYWAADSSVIATGPSLQLPASAQGKRVFLTAISSAAGAHSESDRWDAQRRVQVGNAPSLTSAPAIAGAPKVGATLSVQPGTWSPAPSSIAYQWHRNGQPVPGATGASYALTAADAGTSITVTLTAHLTGHATATVSTAPTSAVAVADAVSFTPTVAGTAAKGKVLTVRGTPTGWSVSYRWTRNGKTIARATGARYRVTTADAGKKIAVVVNASRPGHASAVRTSVARTVSKLGASVKVKLSKASVKRTVKAKATITVKVSGVAKPSGKVVVTYGKKSKTYVLKAKSKGKLTITLPKLAKGKHAITATYKGTSQVAAKKSKKVTLKVS